MAKSKLYAQARTALGAYCQVYDVMIRECNAGSIQDGTLQMLQTRGKQVKDSLAQADAHLKAVEKRIGEEKSAFDRLRNAKNFFKSSAQLTAARKQARTDLDHLEQTFNRIETAVEMVVTFKRAG
jgi:archaellum component FlaC